MKFINLDKQFIKNKKKISSNIRSIISKGNFILGEEVIQLENKLSKYVNSNYCITTSNGTDALLMSLIALDIKPGDEVITSPFSFISAAEVINNIGAKPVFVDVDYDTFNINHKLIEKKITSRTKAIIPVNLFGQCADYDQINCYGKKYNLKIIEDAAQSFGAKYNNKMSCSLADISCTSFFPSKPLGCYGDGGACFTKSKKLYDKLKSIRSHGSLKKYTYSIRGINGRLDTIQAAVLLAKLKYFDAEIKSRNIIANFYNQKLSDKLIKPKIKTSNYSVYAQYTLKLRNRDIIKDKLKKLGIPTMIYYPSSLHKQKVFNKYFFNNSEFKITNKLVKQVLSLPIDPYMTKIDQKYIINKLNSLV